MHSVFSALKLCFFAFYFQYRNNIHIPFLFTLYIFYFPIYLIYTFYFRLQSSHSLHVAPLRHSGCYFSDTFHLSFLIQVQNAFRF